MLTEVYCRCEVEHPGTPGERGMIVFGGRGPWGAGAKEMADALLSDPRTHRRWPTDYPVDPRRVRLSLFGAGHIELRWWWGQDWEVPIDDLATRGR